MEKNECALLISSCDAYKDILDVFFELLKRFWSDLPYDIYLSTETTNYVNNSVQINNIHPLNTQCSWTERISDALHKINSEYIILMLDDFFLYDTVKTDKVRECVKYLKESHKIATFTFYPIVMQSKRSKYKDFLRRETKGKYKVAAILGIWNKKQFLKYLEGYKENIWQWEKNASYRSNNLYPKDEFYALKSSADKIFPYDFAKYGLFSGKWIKATEKLFKDLNVNIDFNKRGFYDESLRTLEKSILSSFEIESGVVPYYALTHKGSSYTKYKKKIRIEEPFEQLYNIFGARSIIRWEPSIHWGFGIKNLSINVVYKDKTEQIIDNSVLFGAFTKINNIYVFNCTTPNVYIPTIENKIISRLIIKGKIVFPLERNLLESSYNIETMTDNPKHKLLYQCLWHEFLVSKEKLYHVDLDSTIVACLNEEQKELKCEQKFNGNKFVQSFYLDRDYTSVEWEPSKTPGFGIKGLKILLRMKNSTYIEIPFKDIEGLPPKVGNMHIFVSSNKLHFNIPIEGAKQIVISGIFVCPIKSKILKKVLYS